MTLVDAVLTPELAKMAKTKDDSQKIGEFLDWLMNEKHLQLCKYEDHGEPDPDEELQSGYYPVMHGSHGLVEELLAEFYGIDLKKADAEREAIYHGLVKDNHRRDVVKQKHVEMSKFLDAQRGGIKT